MNGWKKLTPKIIAVSIYWSLGAGWKDLGQIRVALILTISADSPPSSSTWIHRGSPKTAWQKWLAPDVIRPEHPVTRSLSVLSWIITCFWAVTCHSLVEHSANTVKSPGALNWWVTLLDRLPSTVRNVASVGLTQIHDSHVYTHVLTHGTSSLLCRDKRNEEKYATQLSQGSVFTKVTLRLPKQMRSGRNNSD